MAGRVACIAGSGPAPVRDTPTRLPGPACRGTGCSAAPTRPSRPARRSGTRPGVFQRRKAQHPHADVIALGVSANSMSKLRSSIQPDRCGFHSMTMRSLSMQPAIAATAGPVPWRRRNQACPGPARRRYSCWVGALPRRRLFRRGREQVPARHEQGGDQGTDDETVQAEQGHAPAWRSARRSPASWCPCRPGPGAGCCPPCR